MNSVDLQSAAQQAAQILIPSVLTIMGIAVPVVTTIAVSYFKSLSQSKVMSDLLGLVGQKVMMINQTVVDGLKASLASGAVKPEDKEKVFQEAKDLAMEALKRDAKAQGLWDKALACHGGSEEKLMAWLADAVESKVAAAKAAK